jgi:hypothetical protein
MSSYDSPRECTTPSDFTPDDVSTTSKWNRQLADTFADESAPSRSVITPVPAAVLARILYPQPV